MIILINMIVNLDCRNSKCIDSFYFRCKSI